MFDEKSFYVPDGSFKSLSSGLIASPGMGKSYWLSKTLPEGVRDAPAHRTIYFSPKNEPLSGDFAEAPIIYDSEDLIPALNDNGVVQIFPTPENWDDMLTNTIDNTFDLADQIEANGGVEISEGVFQPFSATLIIDDAQAMDSLSNRKEIPNAVKRATVLGRSRRIKVIFVTHRINALPRLISSNLGEIVLFRTGSADIDNVKRVVGINPDEIPELEPYEWLHINMMTDDLTRYNPV